MRVLLLSPYPEPELKPLLTAFDLEGDEVSLYPHVLDDLGSPDITVLYGYRNLIRGKMLGNHRVINIHPSYLPYNRGASPNLWSWYDDTPKGVSIIQIDRSIDGGPLLGRRLVEMCPTDTLATSYERLRKAAGALFFNMWPRIREGIVGASQMPLTGSCHTVAESETLLSRFPSRYHTPCALVKMVGEVDKLLLTDDKLVI